MALKQQCLRIDPFYADKNIKEASPVDIVTSPGVGKQLQ
jgi:hypothetical protein